MKLGNWTWLALAILVTMLCQVKSEEDKGDKKKKLQIGVKKRIDPEQCKIKSRKGDTLNMHYTVSSIFSTSYNLEFAASGLRLGNTNNRFDFLCREHLKMGRNLTAASIEGIRSSSPWVQDK